MDVFRYLHLMVEQGGSDLFFSVGAPPQLKREGQSLPIGKTPLAPGAVQQLAYQMMSQKQIAEFERDLEMNLAIGLDGAGRFRVNVYYQRGDVAMVVRHIKSQIPNVEQLGLPAKLEELALLDRGLILVVGAAGSGKSTTLATMVDKINRERAEHIITIEDPIEFVHQHKKCVVNQRELYADTRSFKSALKSVLREDPDKVLVGEMRDLETIEAALTIAETGHLTFATLHTNSAVQTINRIIDVFPPHQQPQVRAQLSFTLEAVMCQMLLPRANGQGRVLVLEIMIPNAAIRNLIREDKLHQVYSMMQAGKERSGMQTMNESLMQHYLRRSITMEQALSASTMPEELTQMIHRTPGQAARR